MSRDVGSLGLLPGWRLEHGTMYRGFFFSVGSDACFFIGLMAFGAAEARLSGVAGAEFQTFLDAGCGPTDGL